MQVKNIKGTFLIPYQEIIFANKDLNWDKYLKPQDWDIINGIINATWYPFSTFERCGLAIFNLVAKKNLDAVRGWAKKNASQIFSIYKTIIEANDPYKALSNFFNTRGAFFNFNLFEIELEKVGDKHLKIITTTTHTKKQSVESFTWQLIGWLEYIIEETGGTNPQIELVAQQWKSDPETIMDITWE